MINHTLLRALREGHWERAEHGILFPRQRTLLRGRFTWGVGGRTQSQDNLITAEGIALITADSFPATVYGALFATDVTPTTAWTGATFAGTAGELTSGSEGYVETARPALPTFDASLPMEFNLRTATALVVCGFGLLTGSTKGDTAGSLLSAIRLRNAPVTYDNHDILDVYYSLVGTPV